MTLTDSKQPRKQRLARYNAPLHARQKLMNVHLSKELKVKLGTGRRAIEVRTGDKVRVMRGKFKGKAGTVSRVDLKRLLVFIEGVVRVKAKGGEMLVGLPPSKLMLIEAKMDDKLRKKVMDRTKKAVPSAPAVKPTEKPKAEAKKDAETKKPEAKSGEKKAEQSRKAEATPAASNASK